MNPFQTPVIQPTKTRLSLMQRVLIGLVLAELATVSTGLYHEYRMLEDTFHEVLFSQQTEDRIQRMLEK